MRNLKELTNSSSYKFVTNSKGRDARFSPLSKPDRSQTSEKGFEQLMRVTGPGAKSQYRGLGDEVSGSRMSSFMFTEIVYTNPLVLMNHLLLFTVFTKTIVAYVRSETRTFLP